MVEQKFNKIYQISEQKEKFGAPTVCDKHVYVDEDMALHDFAKRIFRTIDWVSYEHFHTFKQVNSKHMDFSTISELLFLYYGLYHAQMQGDEDVDEKLVTSTTNKIISYLAEEIRKMDERTVFVGCFVYQLNSLNIKTSK